MASLEAFDAVCRRWEEEEHCFLNLMAEADSAEIMSDESRLHLAALLETGSARAPGVEGVCRAVLEEVDRHA